MVERGFHFGAIGFREQVVHELVVVDLVLQRRGLDIGEVHFRLEKLLQTVFVDEALEVDLVPLDDFGVVFDEQLLDKGELMQQLIELKEIR